MDELIIKYLTFFPLDHKGPRGRKTDQILTFVLKNSAKNPGIEAFERELTRLRDADRVACTNGIWYLR